MFTALIAGATSRIVNNVLLVLMPKTTPSAYNAGKPSSKPRAYPWIPRCQTA